MLLLLQILSPWRQEVVHKIMDQYQPVSALNMLATTRCGLGRDGASLAEAE